MGRRKNVLNDEDERLEVESAAKPDFYSYHGNPVFRLLGAKRPTKKQIVGTRSFKDGRKTP